jgi:restriction system protein
MVSVSLSGLLDPLEAHTPSILLQAVVTRGEKTEDGVVIEAVTIPWFKIIAFIKRDPNAVYQLDCWKWEDMIAGAYRENGFDVILTPRSGDKGRDVIATRPGFVSIRIFDQVKAYTPGNLVPANDVRALYGVLGLAGNVSKGIITTTTDFAPGVYKDESLLALMPHRLDLRPREKLIEWLTQTAAKRAEKAADPKAGG